MKIYYLVMKYEPSHNMNQWKESLGPFGTKKEAKEAWELYKPQTISAWSTQVILKTIEISVKDALIILLKNFEAMQGALAAAKVTDEFIL